MAPGHPVFRQLAALASPQLFLCRRPWDDKAERLRTAITVDEVRALKGFFQLSAADGGRRVAIVDAADELNAAAANALLKILEEPPARAVLLLVCHRPARAPADASARAAASCACRPLGPDAARRAPSPPPAPPPDPPTPPLLAALAGGSVGAALGLAAGDGLALYAEIVDAPRAAPRSTAAAPSRSPRPPPAATPPPATS